MSHRGDAMKRRRRGFTLLEVLVTTAISTIVIAGAFMLLRVSNDQLQIIHAKMTLQENLREALFKMAQEVRQTAWHKIEGLGTPGADGIERSGTINFKVPVPTPDSASLVDANLTPRWAHNIQYRLDGTRRQILRTSTDLLTNESKEAILASEVTSLEFSRNPLVPGLITITAGAQRTLSSGDLIPETPIQVNAEAEARNP